MAPKGDFPFSEKKGGGSWGEGFIRVGLGGEEGWDEGWQWGYKLNYKKMKDRRKEGRKEEKEAAEWARLV